MKKYLLSLEYRRKYFERGIRNQVSLLTISLQILYVFITFPSQSNTSSSLDKGCTSQFYSNVKLVRIFPFFEFEVGQITIFTRLQHDPSLRKLITVNNHLSLQLIAKIHLIGLLPTKKSRSCYRSQVILL
jgi:hypothetical protein